MSTAINQSASSRLPTYNEALQWGITPPPRPQWAPPREGQNSSRPRTARVLTNPLRPLFMSTIDETSSRPSTSSGRPHSFLDMRLETLPAEALIGGSQARQGTQGERPVSLPARPSTAQPVSSSRYGFASPLSPHLFPRPTSPSPTPHHDTTEGSVPDPVPVHRRPVVPPGYERYDPIATTYLLRSPLIYSTSGSSPQTPAYQLSARVGTTGRSHQLRIRALDHLESRTFSLSGDGGASTPVTGPGAASRVAARVAAAAGLGASNPVRAVRLDDDNMNDGGSIVYLLQVIQLIPGLGLGPSWRVELQRDPNGDSGGRSKGVIRFEGGGFLGMGNGFMRKSGCKFWHMTKKSDGEREAQMQTERKLMRMYGYQPEYHWNRRLMFSVAKRHGALGLGGRSKGFEWRDGRGRVIAVESAEGRLDLSGLATGMSPQAREALLACWVGRAWASGTLTW